MSSDTVGSESQPAAPTPKDPLYFARFLRQAVDEVAPANAAAWLASQAIDRLTGERVMSENNAAILLRDPRKSWVKAGSVRGIGAALGLEDAAIYVANAVCLDLNPPHSGVVATRLPGPVDLLPEGDQDLIVAMARQLCRARGLIK